jgi:hypothetical protein
VTFWIALECGNDDFGRFYVVCVAIL